MRDDWFIAVAFLLPLFAAAFFHPPGAFTFALMYCLLWGGLGVLALLLAFLTDDCTSAAVLAFAAWALLGHPGGWLVFVPFLVLVFFMPSIIDKMRGAAQHFSDSP